MRLQLPKLNIAIPNFLRHCGYSEISNPHKNNEISHARSLDPGRFYPRFHIYFEKKGVETIFKLHLDSKKPSYGGTAAHAGEYEGPVVEQEAGRIKKISEKFISQNLLGPIGFAKSESRWEKLLQFFKKME